MKDPTSWAQVQGTELVKGGGIRLAVRRAGNPWSFGDFSHDRRFQPHNNLLYRHTRSIRNPENDTLQQSKDKRVLTFRTVRRNHREFVGLLQRSSSHFNNRLPTQERASWKRLSDSSTSITSACIRGNTEILFTCPICDLLMSPLKCLDINRWSYGLA